MKNAISKIRLSFSPVLQPMRATMSVTVSNNNKSAYITQPAAKSADTKQSPVNATSLPSKGAIVTISPAALQKSAETIVKSVATPQSPITAPKTAQPAPIVQNKTPQAPLVNSKPVVPAPALNSTPQAPKVSTKSILPAPLVAGNTPQAPKVATKSVVPAPNIKSQKIDNPPGVTFTPVLDQHGDETGFYMGSDNSKYGFYRDGNDSYYYSLNDSNDQASGNRG